MFCRFCYYDLRGQHMPRCPECGTAFAFDDPGSFLRKEPGSLRRIVLGLRPRRRALVVAMTILLLCSYVIVGFKLPSLTYSMAPLRFAGVNLRSIMTTWLIQKYEHPQQTAFDIDSAKQSMRPSFSPYSEGGAAQGWALVTYLLVHAPLFVVPTMAYLLVLALLVGKRARRGAIVLLVTLSLLLLGSLSPRKTASRLVPGSFAFLNDVVCLPGVDLTNANPQPGRTIAVYDAQSFRRPGRRGIAFADGHI